MVVVIFKLGYSPSLNLSGLRIKGSSEALNFLI